MYVQKFKEFFYCTGVLLFLPWGVGGSLLGTFIFPLAQKCCRMTPFPTTRVFFTTREICKPKDKNRHLKIKIKFHSTQENKRQWRKTNDARFVSIAGFMLSLL